VSPSSPDRNEAPPGTREHEGALTYDGCEPSPAQVVARHRDAAARTARAVRTWAIGWGLAVVAVFLPVLHFVLVPLLLVGGPAFALRRLRESATLVCAAGACPACHAAQRFALGDAWRERTSLRCEACGRAIVLVLPPQPPDA